MKYVLLSMLVGFIAWACARLNNSLRLRRQTRQTLERMAARGYAASPEEVRLLYPDACPKCGSRKLNATVFFREEVTGPDSLNNEYLATTVNYCAFCETETGTQGGVITGPTGCAGDRTTYGTVARYKPQGMAGKISLSDPELSSKLRLIPDYEADRVR